jgi:hypothetical protein
MADLQLSCECLLFVHIVHTISAALISWLAQLAHAFGVYPCPPGQLARKVSDLQLSCECLVLVHVGRAHTSQCSQALLSTLQLTCTAWDSTSQHYMHCTIGLALSDCSRPSSSSTRLQAQLRKAPTYKTHTSSGTLLWCLLQAAAAQA